MDRQAFRNRMQQLKQYREQNPGKTYLDFKKYSDYIKKAYKEHKNISSYTKWFNSIPLLSVGALGVYGYENTNE